MPAESPLAAVHEPSPSDVAEARARRRERLAGWSTRCLAASWVVACLLVAVAAASTSSPFLVVLVTLVALALGCVVLAALALWAQRTRQGWWLLGIAVVNLAVVPGAAFVVGLVVSIAIHGFDLPT